VLAKVSAVDHHDEVRADYWAVFDVGDAQPGDQAVAVARAQAEAFAAKWGSRYPSAVACVTGDLASLTVHLRFPAEHWHRIRHSNLIERTFGETRRRVKVIGRLPGEQSCLSLVWASGPGLQGLAWPDDDPQGTAPAPRSPSSTPGPRPTRGGSPPTRRTCRLRSLRSLRPEPFTPLLRRHPTA
jgi:hypothetical protein